MAATSEQTTAGAPVTDTGGPLTPPGSPTESGPTQARNEDSLLGATPAMPAEKPPQPQEQTPPAEAAPPARPSYTEFKLPEGVTADAESLKPATELFADSGLSQEQAQKFIDLALAREAA